MPGYPSGDVDAPEAADTMCAMAGYERRTRRFSRAEYKRLIDLGVSLSARASAGRTSRASPA